MTRVGLMGIGLAMFQLTVAGGCGKENRGETTREPPPPVVQSMQIVPDSQPTFEEDDVEQSNGTERETTTNAAE